MHSDSVSPAHAHDGALETTLLLTALHASYGADFRGFNPLVVASKLAALASERGLPHISALQGELLRDRELGRQVIRLLGAGVHAGMPDPQLLTALRLAMVPILRSSPWPAVWIADCTGPGLVVLIAAMLEEEGLLERTQLYVTSADETLVQDMASLRLSAPEAEQLDSLHSANGGRASLRAHLAADGDGFVLGAAAGAALSCHVHDLASDASFREFETVLCARPLREYGVALLKRALGIFSDSLCGFGVLQIDPAGPMRTLAADFSMAPLLPGQGLYRRLPR